MKFPFGCGGLALICTLIFAASVNAKSLWMRNPQGRLITPTGQEIITHLALTLAEQQQGLSGLAAEQLPTGTGLLFPYDEMAPRAFWMPNMLFALDILFLDRELKIIEIVENLPAHPGYQTPPAIARTPPVISSAVLELKGGTAKTKFALKKGDQLKWRHERALMEILKGTHRP